jgi:type II secretion system protein I
MIALAVFSVVAMALTKNASLAVTQTARMQDQLIAHTVAQNVLNDLLSSGRRDKAFEGPSRQQSEVTMASRSWQVQVRLRPTDDADIKRVRVSVRDDQYFDEELAVLTGFVGRQ